jgi:PII-like signaling protein
VFHTAKILELSTTLPVKIEVVDTQLKIDEILLEITPIVHKGLITVGDTVVVKSSS